MMLITLTANQQMAARKKSKGVKLKRLEAQTRVICTFNRIICAMIALILGMAVVATALPQKRRLAELEAKLAKTLDAESEVLAEREFRETELSALKEDYAFLELKAMDRLNLHREGERVYRFKRSSD